MCVFIIRRKLLKVAAVVIFPTSAMVLFEIHQRFKGHFLNEFCVSWNIRWEQLFELRYYGQKHLWKPCFRSRSEAATGGVLYKKVFSCEFCKICKNTFFTKHLRTTASGRFIQRNVNRKKRILQFKKKNPKSSKHVSLAEGLEVSQKFLLLLDHINFRLKILKRSFIERLF